MGNNTLNVISFFMKFFNNYKFLWRISRIPRELFIFSKDLDLWVWELDFLTKLFNFSNFSEIKPNLDNFSKKAWTSKRSYQDIIKKLKNKGYLEVCQNRSDRGYFETNTYNINGLFSAINQLKDQDKQLVLDFNTKFSFWEGSSTLESNCVVCSPRVLDFFQKELKISQKENLVLKYLFWYTDDNYISEVSLNIIAKTTCISRQTLTRAIKWLSEKGLIIIKEQFVGHWRKIRYKNRYDLKPLLEQLNELERQKVEKKLKEQWKWKDYNQKRTYSRINKKVEEKEIKQEKKQENNQTRNQERINYIKNEIFRLKPRLKSKYWKLADHIRSLELELNELKNNNIQKQSLSSLISDRLSKLSQKKSISTSWEIIKARNICERVCWNWEKNKNLYIKAVRFFPNTVERYAITSIEKAKKSKENYFSVCLKKDFQKLQV